MDRDKGCILTGMIITLVLKLTTPPIVLKILNFGLT